MTAKILSMEAKRARTVECEVSSVERLLLALEWKREGDMWRHPTIDEPQPIAAAFACTMHAIIKDAEGNAAS